MSGLRNLGPVFAYFNANALKTNKADSYKLFVELYDRLRLKHHLDPVLLFPPRGETRAKGYGSQSESWVSV